MTDDITLFLPNNARLMGVDPTLCVLQILKDKRKARVERASPIWR